MTDMTGPATLPDRLLALLDGDDLDAKVGHTLLLTSVDAAGWPRQALLSAGEVVAVAPDTLRIVTYAGSRTTRALAEGRRALLTTVVDGLVHKVDLEATPVPEPADAPVAGRTWFVARVVSVDVDDVAYARVRHGIVYELPDPAPVVARWREQVATLRADWPMTTTEEGAR